MAPKKEKRAGYGKILDTWVAPADAGDPVGCVATSFTFSPVFFEEECLSRFLRLETDPNEDGPLYLVEREEKLAQAICTTALVDQHYCKGKRSLRWDLLSARVPGSILHAKISLLYWNHLIRIVVASANLTEDGYRRNQEVFGVLDYYPGGMAPLSCLTSIVQFLRKAANHSQADSQTPAPALSRLDVFLNKVEQIPGTWGIGAEVSGRNGIKVNTVLIESEIPDAFTGLNEIWPGNSPPVKTKVVSPFFDPSGDDNRPADALWQTMRRRGEAHIEFYVTADEIPGEDSLFIHAPESLLFSQPENRKTVRTDFYKVALENNRPLHAKGIWLEDDRWAVYMIGSSNFTSAGLGLLKKPNLEANLVYVVDKKRDRNSFKQLEQSFTKGELINLNKELRWQPRIDQNEDSSAGVLILPSAFGTATYDCDENQIGKIILTFNSSPPAGWTVKTDEDDKSFYTEPDWIRSGAQKEVTVLWQKDRPPSGFWVQWQGAGDHAWWPVNIASMNSLPPPEVLKDLPLEVLVNVLTSARPLHKVLGEYLKRREKSNKADGIDRPIVNPHDKVDTSYYLLQKTRRVTWALNALRERLERPTATEESLNWRLRGPVGVMALAKALIKESNSKEEEAFLITELALELYRANPQEAVNCLAPVNVRQKIMEIVVELRGLVPADSVIETQNLKDYSKKVFRTIIRQ